MQNNIMSRGRVWSLPHVYIADNNNYYYSGYCPITNIILCIVTLEFKMNSIMRINGSNVSTDIQQDQRRLHGQGLIHN